MEKEEIVEKPNRKSVSTIQILKPQSRNDNNSMKSMYMPSRCRECEVHGWRPEAREGATLTAFPATKIGDKWIEERAYLFGGLSRDLYSSIAYLKVDHQEGVCTWVFVDQGEPLKKRYGHTANYWDNKLVIVAGAKMYNNDMKRRECMGDVNFYDPVYNNWTEVIATGAYFEPRRYHVSVIVGTSIVVNGGLSDKEVYLSSTITLNLAGLNDAAHDREKMYRWLNVKAEGTPMGSVARHAGQLVLMQERFKLAKFITLTSMPELRYIKLRIPFEGIYYFGGLTENGPSNEVNILKIGRKPVEWVKPDIKGKRPPPRYGHSMNYFAEKSILVVFGGRNDEEYENTGFSCMNDIWILSCERLEWTQWEQHESVGEFPSARYSHTSAVVGKSILIFGGLGDENYSETKIFSIDMIPRHPGEKIRFGKVSPKPSPLTSPKMGDKIEMKGILARKETNMVKTNLAPAVMNSAQKEVTQI